LIDQLEERILLIDRSKHL